MLNKLAAVDISVGFLSGSGGTSLFTDLSVVGKLVSFFLKASFALAGLILLFYFIMGGIGMISSAGADNPKGAEQAKATVTSAVIGFVVVFTAYWIVKLIGKLLGIDNLI